MKNSAILRLTSPLHQGSEKSRTTPTELPQGVGTNYTPHRRLPITLKIGNRETITPLPAVSGNSIRHNLRESLVDVFLTAIDFDKAELSGTILEMLTNGGGMDKKDELKNEKDEAKNGSAPLLIRNRETLRALMPTLSLFGCSYGNRMLEGILDIGWAIPALKETSHLTRYESSVSYSTDLTSYELGTRTNALELEEGEKSKQSLYYNEVVSAGTPFYHFYKFKHLSSPIERSAMQLAIDLFKENGSLGGKSSVGYGHFEAIEWYADLDVSSGLYLDWLEKNKETIKAYIKLWDKPEQLVKVVKGKQTVEFPENLVPELDRLVQERKDYIQAENKKRLSLLKEGNNNA